MKIFVNRHLPPDTIMVSPDVYDAMKAALPTETDGDVPALAHSSFCGPFVPVVLGGTRISVAPPLCEKHKVQMVLSFYDRPGSPQGNGWTCPECVRERTEPPLPTNTPLSEMFTFIPVRDEGKQG